VYRLEAGDYCHAAVDAVDRPALAFQTCDGSIVVDCHDQAVAVFLRFFQVTHVAGMDNVEAAVGKHDLFAVRARIGHGELQLRGRHDAAIRATVALHLAAQLRTTDGRRTELGDDETCSNVG